VSSLGEQNKIEDKAKLSKLARCMLCARQLRGYLIAAFCLWHVFALTLANLRSLEIEKGTLQGDRFEQVTEPFAAYTSLVNSEQDWAMYAPNVPDESYLPILQLSFNDGSQLVLRSSSEPDLLNADASNASSLDPDASESQRRYAWRYRFGGLSKRKFHEHAASGKPSIHAWVRHRLAQHLRAMPSDAQRITRIECRRITISHVDASGYAHFIAANAGFDYAPADDPLWSGPLLPALSNLGSDQDG